MQISDFLSPDDVIADAPEPGKERLLRALSRRAAGALGRMDDLVASKILERESLGSTGLGGGIAVPHARLDGLAQPYGVCVRLRKAIEFDAIDGRPVDIVFLLLLPAAATSDPLGALASVARKLRDQAVVTALRAAADGAAMYRVLADSQPEPG